MDEPKPQKFKWPGLDPIRPILPNPITVKSISLSQRSLGKNLH